MSQTNTSICYRLFNSRQYLPHLYRFIIRLIFLEFFLTPGGHFGWFNTISWLFQPAGYPPNQLPFRIQGPPELLRHTSDIVRPDEIEEELLERRAQQKRQEAEEARAKVQRQRHRMFGFEIGKCGHLFVG